MSKKATEDDVVYEEDDDEMDKNMAGQRREGRRIKKKGSYKNKWFIFILDYKVHYELVSWIGLKIFFFLISFYKTLLFILK